MRDAAAVLQGEAQLSISTATLGSVTYWRAAFSRPLAFGNVKSVLLLALIGVELVVLMAVLPETLEMWWRADRVGDFVTFFGAAEEL